MATPYVKRYPGGFLDLPNQTTPADAAFLNAIEAALIALYGSAPSADGQIPLWNLGAQAYVPGKLTDANVATAAAIAVSKLATGNPGQVVKTKSGAVQWDQPVVTATTVAGLGTPSDGVAGFLKVGAGASYDSVPLVYDATLAKWVSPEFPIVSQVGSWNATDGASTELRFVFSGSSTVELAYSFIRAKPFTDAGLRLQLRVIGHLYGTNSAAPTTTQVFAGVSEGDIGTLGSPLANVNAAVASVDIATTANSTFKLVDSGWSTLSTAATKDIWRITTSLNSGAAQTVRWIGSMRARWVG